MGKQFAVLLVCCVGVVSAQPIEPQEEISSFWVRWLFDQEVETDYVVISADNYRHVLEAIDDMNTHYQQMYNNYDMIANNYDALQLQYDSVMSEHYLLEERFIDEGGFDYENCARDYLELRDRADDLMEHNIELSDRYDLAQMEIEFLRQDNSDL